MQRHAAICRQTRDIDISERGATVMTVGEGDVADDTARHALRAAQLFLKQLEKDVEVQRHEAEMRENLPDFVATGDRNELSAIQEEI